MTTLRDAQLTMIMTALRIVGHRLTQIEKRCGISRADDADFNEADHPRAEDGRFGTKSGSKAASPPEKSKETVSTKKASPPASAAEPKAARTTGFLEAKSVSTPKLGKDGKPVFDKAGNQLFDTKHYTGEGKELPAHVLAAKVPGGIKDVRYNPDPNGELIAVGKDSKGREYRNYAASFMAENSANKFSRIESMYEDRHNISAQNAIARQSNNAKTKAAADCTFLIEKMGIRPGSDDDTGAKVKAYGATTLQGNHVVQEDDGSVHLRFTGKKGVALNLPVHDKAVADMLLARKKRGW